jgi:hypothetical protein
MKKANYYKVHKNKRPNRLIKKSNRFKSMVLPLVALTSVMSAMQITNIQSQPIPKYSEKESNRIVNLNRLEKLISITEIAKNQVNAFSKIIKSEQIRRFKLTKRYVK